MNSEIEISKDLCKHIEEYSSYNNNYYKLPEGMKIKGFDVILEICNEDYDSYDYILGHISEKAFKDDGSHLRYPADHGFYPLDKKIILNLEREGQYNT